MRHPICITALAVMLALAAPAVAKGPQCPSAPKMSRAIHQALYRAQQKMAQKDLTAAAKELAQFAQGREGHHQLSFLQGVLAYQAEDKTTAAEHFARAVQLYPCFVPGLRNLALMRFEQGRPKEAAGLAYQAYQLSKPPQPALLYEAAAFRLAAGQPAQALPWLKTLAALPQPKKQWLSALLQAHLSLKQYKPARKVLDRLLTAYPGQARFWRLAASLAARRGRYAQAAAALEVAYRLEPPGPSGWKQLGELYSAAGVPLMAARYYERAWGPDIKEPKRLDRLARVYLQGNYPDRALKWAHRAVKAKPSAKRWALVGRIELAQKRYGKAYAAYEKATKLEDKKGRHSLMAGYAAWQQERLEQAQRSFSRALKLAPAGSGTARDAARALKNIRALQEAVRRERTQNSG